MAIKAVIDTNIWVSALLNPCGYPAQLRKAFEIGSFLPITICRDKDDNMILETLRALQCISELGQRLSWGAEGAPS